MREGSNTARRQSSAWDVELSAIRRVQPSKFVTFQTVQLTSCNSFKTLLLVLLLRLLNPLIVTPILKSLHWLKVNECIEYKLLSLTYKVLTTAQPSYLYNLFISLQPPRSTRSSSVVTLSRPPTISLKITDRSFRCASPRVWNQLTDSFCQPHQSCYDHFLMHSHHHHFQHPLLPRSFIQGTKLTFSTSPSNHNRLLAHPAALTDNHTTGCGKKVAP